MHVIKCGDASATAAPPISALPRPLLSRSSRNFKCININWWPSATPTRLAPQNYPVPVPVPETKIYINKLCGRLRRRQHCMPQYVAGGKHGLLARADECNDLTAELAMGAWQVWQAWEKIYVTGLAYDFDQTFCKQNDLMLDSGAPIFKFTFRTETKYLDQTRLCSHF